MIDHLELQTRNVEETAGFYAAVLSPLGYERMMDEAVKGFGDGKRMDLFIVEGEPSANVHYAFAAPDRTTVDTVFEIATVRGYRLDRKPALAPHIHPNYYAAYLRDPDGRLVEFVTHGEE